MATSRGPYGLWASPLTPEGQAHARRLNEVTWDTDGRTLLWVEGRSGHGMLLAGEPGEAPRELTPELSVRARVGYGGGDMTASHGTVVFSSGGQLYAQAIRGGQAVAITPPYGDVASPCVSPEGRWVLYVHSDGRNDCLAVADIAGRFWPQRLHAANDFYMQPVWHPHGKHVAWVSWRHPQIPWDGSLLYLGGLDRRDDAPPVLVTCEVMAGNDATAVFQPAFSPDGRYLSYASDASGWFGLYLRDLESGQVRALVEEEAEWGVAAWAQGMCVQAWSPDSRSIYACRSHESRSALWRIDVETGSRCEVSLGEGYADVQHPAISAKGDVAVIASGPAIPPRVLVYRPSSATVLCMARSRGETIGAEALSAPRHVTWLSAEGTSVYGLFYAPAGDEQPVDELPPLIVTVHGGPTGGVSAGFSGQAQFFATRGYAVLDVCYRGSTGYGRRYRDLLKGQWGLWDVDDAVSGARAMVERGWVDGQRLVIMGGSAGGFTVLQALIRYPHAFRAGVCLYGVTNLFTLASDTHKFEQHYLDSLIGPLPAQAQRYRDRSPIFHADQIVDPVALFQGDDDRVVPPQQAESIVTALRRTGSAHEYHVYPGEGHGWRKAETIAAFYRAVLRFLRDHVLYA